MKNYGKDLIILFDQWIMSQVILMKNYENQIQFRWLFTSEENTKIFNTIFIWSVFNDGNKYYPKVFLDECLYKLARLGVGVGVRWNSCLRRLIEVIKLIAHVSVLFVITGTFSRWFLNFNQKKMIVVMI